MHLSKRLFRFPPFLSIVCQDTQHSLRCSLHLDMRKIYWRRQSLSTIILSFALLSLISLTTILSLIYDTSIPCFDTNATSLVPLPSIPRNYIVVPYREFVLRTSISCNRFKLDNPAKSPTSLHPKYSQHLRGAFPYVVPYSNITFDDIEQFYTKTLGPKRTSLHTPFSPNVSFEHIPYRFEHGMWYPTGLRSAQRTAILVPLQGRDYNAKVFLLNMHAFARRQLLTYTIVLLEQVSLCATSGNETIVVDR